MPLDHRYVKVVILKEKPERNILNPKGNLRSPRIFDTKDKYNKRKRKRKKKREREIDERRNNDVATGRHYRELNSR